MSLHTLLCFLDEEPCLGRLLIVEMLAAGRPVLERRARVLEHVAKAVAQGEEQAKRTAPAAAIRLTAEGVVGAVLSVLHGRLLEERSEPLHDLWSPLMSMIVLPYLGPAAARRELARHAPGAGSSAGPPATMGNPLKDLRMRLTYRTARVLCVVASSPGSSNRQTADASGIDDQGQISKLLARLQRLGLIYNANTVGRRGDPNAWVLTERGEAVHASLLAHVS
jgi:hypothetical protein